MTIDLRSDTRTLPDQEMKAAMVAATLGDDSFGDDPTVRELEEQSSALTGKAAALFTCSGTMSNLLAVLALGGMDEGALVVAGADAHLMHYENDNVRILGRGRVLLVPDAPFGELDTRQAAGALAGRGPAPAVLCLENTHNRLGGNALPASVLAGLAAVARQAGASVHLDGARLPNAAVALGEPVAELARGADTVAISLCKGLTAPAGSVLAGSSEVIGRARYLRRMIGGTMHQSGMLAGAGLVALGRIGRLAEDHRRAALLAAGLSEIPGLVVRTVPHPTNMVFAGVPGCPADELAGCLARHGVLGLPVTSEEVRFVLHAGHEDGDVSAAAAACARAVASLPSSSLGSADREDVADRPPGVGRGVRA
jgi:threonine aldolase